MDYITDTAPAKLNLYLHVTGQRDDGYHTLDGLVAFLGVQDTLRVAPLENGVSLAIMGPLAPYLDVRQNLIYRAARALREACEVPEERGAAFTLEKHIPIAAGLGGGSADAAAALRLLCRLWEIMPEPGVLEEVAAGVGADVPVCLEGSAAFIGGIGEEVAPVVLPVLHLVLVNPRVMLPTAGVFAKGFKHYRAAVDRPEFSDAAMVVDFLRAQHNDLTENAAAEVPQIWEVLAALEALPGCALARMSGSGATCFGVFSDAEAAKAAADLLCTQRPDWWVERTATLG